MLWFDAVVYVFVFCFELEIKDKKEIFSSICFLTIRFCVFAFADYVGFLRMVPLLCTYQHSMDGRR